MVAIDCKNVPTKTSMDSEAYENGNIIKGLAMCRECVVKSRAYRIPLWINELHRIALKLVEIPAKTF